MKKTTLLAIAFLCLTGYQANAQLDNNQPKFNPLFDFRATPYRSASGAPGEQYWQNRADYTINAELDDQNHAITSTVKITYTNNSPDNLDFVWLQLDQNKFKGDSRGTLVQNLNGSRNRANATSGYDIKSVKSLGKDVKYIVEDSRMQIRLDAPIKAKGGKLEIEIAYGFSIPEYGSDRMGRVKAEKGWVYSIAQWFPRMAVYDDIKGWNVEPYLGSGEFYLEYGNLDYKITTSNKIVVLGSGAIQNPAECYTPEQVARWEKAKNSDTKVDIIKADEVGTRPAGTNGKITWHFKIENSRDAAFGASEAFIVDACRINLPSGKKSMAISGYPKESLGDGGSEKAGWERSTEFSKAAIEYYSKWLFEFPYASANNCASICGGMEYPGLNFCQWKDKGEGLWGVTDHEFGHNWFPMIVGSNERLYPWMDEGFNTFINHYSTMAFNNKEFYNPAGFTLGNVRNPQLQGFVVKNPRRESIATYPDVVQDAQLGVTAYFKPGLGLWLLREYILGPDRFDYAFRTYIKRWAFKHPQPADFFNTMENAAGEELDWFWKEWFYGTGLLDQSVEKVKYIRDDPAQGSIVTIKNNGEVILPVVVDVTEEDGKVTRVNLPVEIWQKTNVKDFRVATTKKITKVQIDPERKLPDTESKNDVWTPEIEAQKKAEEEAKKKAEEEAKKQQEQTQQQQATPTQDDGKKKKKSTK
jgi:hypothetical protein